MKELSAQFETQTGVTLLSCKMHGRNSEKEGNRERQSSEGQTERAEVIVAMLFKRNWRQFRISISLILLSITLLTCLSEQCDLICTHRYLHVKCIISTHTFLYVQINTEVYNIMGFEAFQTNIEMYTCKSFEDRILNPFCCIMMLH